MAVLVHEIQSAEGERGKRSASAVLYRGLRVRYRSAELRRQYLRAQLHVEADARQARRRGYDTGFPVVRRRLVLRSRKQDRRG